MRHANPLINFRPLRDRNFAISCIIIFCAFGVLYARAHSLPALLQSLFGYDAYHAGLVLSPAGILRHHDDRRRRRSARPRRRRPLADRRGLLIMAAGNYWMSQLNLDISPWQVVWPRVVMIVGLLIFAPLNVAAYHLHPAFPARRRRRSARAAAQRRRQRRHLAWPRRSWNAASNSTLATGRISRSAQSRP